MRKEVILAIIIGVILGGIVLYGLKIANQTVVVQKTEEEATPAAITITPTPAPIESLTFDSPADHAVSFSSTITLVGHTTPLTAVAITSESEDEIIESDNIGNFSTEVTLIGGENIITASVPLQDGTVYTKSLTVIYTSTTIDN